MRPLFLVALLLVAVATMVAAGSNLVANNNNEQGVKKELAYDDMETLFKDVAEHPEWFGFGTVADVVDGAAVGAAAGDAYHYTYSQTSGRFSGPAFNGGSIDVTGCSGASGNCRNNPSCQCQVDVGPLPQGGYQLSSMITFKGMPYCYALTQTSGNACGRSGFLIHGGSCSPPYNPSEGCIVIPDQSQRYRIKGGGTLTVTA